jgi:hypothetical protein
MAGIPDEAIAWGLEGVMESDRELGHPKARSEVTSDLRDHIDMPLPNLSGEELELPSGKGSKICGKLHTFENGHPILPESLNAAPTLSRPDSIPGKYAAYSESET